MPMPNTQQTLYSFYYLEPNYNLFYRVNCKLILQDSARLDDQGSYDRGSYDHGFFFHWLTSTSVSYFVMCKVYSYASIENKLNGIDTSDTDNLKRETLTLNQKLSLEQGLKEILPTKI